MRKQRISNCETLIFSLLQASSWILSCIEVI